MPGHDTQSNVTTTLRWCEEMDLWEDRYQRQTYTSLKHLGLIMHFSPGENVFSLMLNLVQEPVSDLYKYSLELKNRVCKTFLKSDAYPKCKRTEQEMKVLKPSKTLWWVDNITCECMPRVSIWRVKENDAKVTSGPVLHGHFASSGLLLLGKLEIYSLTLQYVCGLSACPMIPWGR